MNFYFKQLHRKNGKRHLLETLHACSLLTENFSGQKNLNIKYWLSHDGVHAVPRENFYLRLASL